MSPTPSTEPVRAFDTHKNRVCLYEDRVHKTFKPVRASERRARQELTALRLLAGLEGIPVVLASGLTRMTVVLSRVPGKPLSECESVAEHTMVSLRRLVEKMLDRGIARHSLPARDVLVARDGSAGLVDFERSTRRLFPWEPGWLVAKAITRFHMMRLVHQHAPHLLTPSEQRWFRWQVALHAALQHPVDLRRRLARAFRRSRWLPLVL
jgi:hypothetical protein